MKSRIKYLWMYLFSLMFMMSVAYAQTAQPAPPAAQSNFSQPELDQMLAPIALYPDGLLSQMLMASTYPADVVEAARWSRAHPSLKGDAAVNAVTGRQWDISVKSLLAFPQVLSTMNTKIDWTERLGQAFQGQFLVIRQGFCGSGRGGTRCRGGRRSGNDRCCGSRCRTRCGRCLCLHTVVGV